MQKIRWAVCGLGGISHQFVRAAKKVMGMEVVACISSSMERALAFREKYHLEEAYTYDMIPDMRDVDAVYVCTNMHLHHSNTLACLQAGMHVLCEKSFSLTAQEAREMVAAARQQERLLMEAMWTRFLPATKEILAYVQSGRLGQVLSLEGYFLSQMRNNPDCRLFHKELGGGSMLDLMVYPVSYARFLMQQPEIMDVSGQVENGVDVSCDLTLLDANGVSAQLHSSCVSSKRKNNFSIVCEKGTIQVPLFHMAHSYCVKKDGGSRKWRITSLPGYQYEIDHFNWLIRAGKLESELRPHTETIAVMQILEQANLALGVDFTK